MEGTTQIDQKTKRERKNKREKTRVKEIAEWYRKLAISQGWKGQRPPRKLDILSKTIVYIEKLQEQKRQNHSSNQGSGSPYDSSQCSSFPPSTSSSEQECMVEHYPSVAQTVTISDSQPADTSLVCFETLADGEDSSDGGPQTMLPDSTTDSCYLMPTFQTHCIQSVFSPDCSNLNVHTPSTNPLLGNIQTQSPCLFHSPTVTAVPNTASPSEFFQTGFHIPQSSSSFLEMPPGVPTAGFNSSNSWASYSPATANFAVMHC